MYTLYLDETGDWGYPNYHPKYPILCLCGSIFHDEYYSKQITLSLLTLKEKRFGNDVVLHRHKVKARMNEFSGLKTQQRADEFMAELSQHIANLDFKILLSALNKADYYRTYGLKKVDMWLPADIYSMLFIFVVERFLAFLLEHREKGKIIAESRGRREDQKVQFWYSPTLEHGTQFYRSWQFQRALPPTIEFRPKSDSIYGLQVSDWIASPMSRKVQYPEGSEDKFGEWELYKGKIWLGENAPARGQVGFKVFPKNLGRKLMNMPLKSA